MNQTRMWFCDICDKSIFNKNKSQQIESKYRKCCEKFNVFVKEYEFIRPDIIKIDPIIDNSLRDCYNKYFRTFKTVYDVEKEDGDSVTSISSDKKKQITRENGFLHELTIKIYSQRRYLNICYDLKQRIPIIYRQFFSIISQNSEYVKVYCNDMSNPFDLSCRKWYLDNQSP